MRRGGATGLSVLLALLSRTVGAIIGGSAPIPVAAAAQSPNIVVLMVDDLGVMLNDEGQPDDRLLSVLPTINSTFLKHGLRFTDYIGNNPLCCPAARTS